MNSDRYVILEGPIKKLLGDFEVTLFLDIELREFTIVHARLR